MSWFSNALSYVSSAATKVKKAYHSASKTISKNVSKIYNKASDAYSEAKKMANTAYTTIKKTGTSVLDKVSSYKNKLVSVLDRPQHFVKEMLGVGKKLIAQATSDVLSHSKHAKAFFNFANKYGAKVLSKAYNKIAGKLSKPLSILEDCKDAFVAGYTVTYTALKDTGYYEWLADKIYTHYEKSDFVRNAVDGTVSFSNTVQNYSKKVDTLVDTVSITHAVSKGYSTLNDGLDGKRLVSKKDVVGLTNTFKDGYNKLSGSLASY